MALSLRAPLRLLFALASAGPAMAQVIADPVKIGIGGPLTTTSAGFGVEMRQAVEFAIDERNASGGLAGEHMIAVAVEGKGDVGEGKAVDRNYCEDHAMLCYAEHV